MRRERRQDVLHGAVLVDVAGDAQRRQVAHLVGGGDRAAEHEDRQLARRRACGSSARGRRRRQCGSRRSRTIRSMRARSARTRASSSAALLTVSARVPGAEQRRRETVAHERGVVGDDDGLVGCHSGSRHGCVSVARFRALGSLQNLSGSRYNSKPCDCRGRRAMARRVSNRRVASLVEESVWPPVPNVMPKSKSTSSTSTRAT